MTTSIHLTYYLVYGRS